MDVDRIQTALGRFLTDHRVVFWSDPDREFEDVLPSLNVSNAQVVKVSETSALETKLAVAAGSADDRFLIYEDRRQPEPGSDWLLDIRLYAKSFSADRSTHILEDLGLHSPALRDHIAGRARFFASRERMARFRRLVSPKDSEIDIDRKIMATLLKLDNADFFGIVIALFDAFPDKTDISSVPEVWAEFEKFDIAESFWKQVEAIFGFQEARPTLGNLLIGLLVTDFARKLNGKTPKALAHLKLPGAGATNAIVCVGQWQDSVTRHASFDRLSDAVANAILLKAHIHSVEPEYLEDTRTFSLIERRIASGLRDRIIDTYTAVDVDEVSALVRRRRDGYWANEALGETAPRRAFARVYDALQHAAQLFSLKGTYQGGFSYPTAKAFWDAYVTDLYRFDQLYRHFCEAADQVEAKGWDILKALRQKVEDVYGNGFVAPLAMSWSGFVDDMLTEKWVVEDVPLQSRFFDKHIHPLLSKDQDRRAIVIVSDAFRYEAAKELADQINGRDRMEASLSTQLGVLPSYTALGMASLLPHKDLGFSNGIVTVDGKSSSGMENRGKILAEHRGAAVQAEALMAMSVDEGRRFLKSHRVVYVYHNHIDKTADGGDEEKAFDAVRRTIDEIASLATRILGSLNGTNVFVTADHGFLYQETPPTLVDKNAVEAKPAGAILAKKRYFVGSKLGTHPGAWAAPMSRTSDIRDETEFWIPKGTNRFHFVGGARYLHGGAMLQEICVPVLRIGYRKNEQGDTMKARSVRISALGTGHRITTPRRSFDLMQTEPVTDRVKALKVTVAICGKEGPVSDVQTITFDSKSKSLHEDWRRSVRLTLGGSSFDKSDHYRLVVRDTETKVEVLSQDVVIDLAIARDFD